MTLVCPFQPRILCDSIQGIKCISWTRPGIPQPRVWWLVAACTAHTVGYSHHLFPSKALHSHFPGSCEWCDFLPQSHP